METKICCICKTELPKTDNFFAKKKQGYQCQCRNCQKKYRRGHYLLNKQRYIDKAKNYMKKTKEWFLDYKKDLKCENCGESRWWVLDFHHKDPNEKDCEISTLLQKGNKNKITEEIKKCTVLCSNCHRDLHYQEKQNAE